MWGEGEGEGAFGVCLPACMCDFVHQYNELIFVDFVRLISNKPESNIADLFFADLLLSYYTYDIGFAPENLNSYCKQTHIRYIRVFQLSFYWKM